MHWLWQQFGLFTILLFVIAALCVYAFGWDMLGLVVRLLLKIFPFLRFNPDKKGFAFNLHAQSESLGYPWGFGFRAWGRKFFYFHYYMGWSNHSERHRSDQCTDSAYCPHHGSL